MRHILLFLLPRDDVAAHLSTGSSGLFDNDHIAMLWLRSVTEAAWTVWVTADTGELPQ